MPPIIGVNYGTDANPIQLRPIEVIGKKPNWFNRNIVIPVKRFIQEEKETNPIFGTRRVAVNNTASKRNYFYLDNWRPEQPILDIRDRALIGSSYITTRKRFPLPGYYYDNIEPKLSAAQATYLVPRETQRRWFYKWGYLPGTKGDYGLVRKAVNKLNRQIPIYLKAPDADNVTREDLTPLGNIYVNGLTHLDWHGDPKTALVHAGQYPTAVYIDLRTGKLYLKAWDLNDYGKSSAGSKGATYGSSQWKAELADKIGNPTVITTGFQRIDPRVLLKVEPTAETAPLLLHYKKRYNEYSRTWGSVPDGMYGVIPINEYLIGDLVSPHTDEYLNYLKTLLVADGLTEYDLYMQFLNW